MSRRAVLLAPLGALLLAGCVDRGGWQPTAQIAPQKLELGRTVADAQIAPSVWPADGWWRSYGDPQLDTLVDEALAGSPSLATAQARLRAAQGQVVTARAARLPTTTVSALADRQRYPEDYLFPPPFAGGYVNNGRAALDFSWDLDFLGRNRALLAQARSGVAAAEADRAAARLALAVAVLQVDVTNDNLKQQQSILELTEQRVSA
ncbi:MAG: TolC family protein, partial [Steroidobacteraceae bacterium]